MSISRFKKSIFGDATTLSATRQETPPRGRQRSRQRHHTTGNATGNATDNAAKIKKGAASGRATKWGGRGLRPRPPIMYFLFYLCCVVLSALSAALLCCLLRCLLRFCVACCVACRVVALSAALPRAWWRCLPRCRERGGVACEGRPSAHPTPTGIPGSPFPFPKNSYF